jgi:hypothetical protein
MKQKHLKKFVCAGAAAVLTIGSTRAAIIYNDAASYNNNLFAVANGEQIGNEISLNASSLSSFAIEYYDPNPGALAANVGVDVRFYYNNGPLANGYLTPGTEFFDSGWFYNTTGGILGGGSSGAAHDINYNTGDFASGAQNGWAPSYPLTGNFTFTITWTNLNAANQIQMPLANNTPGISTGAYWLNNNGSFELLTNAVPANLLVEFDGQASAVPEPSTVLAGVLMLLPFGAVGVRALRKQRAA